MALPILNFFIPTNISDIFFTFGSSGMISWCQNIHSQSMTSKNPDKVKNDTKYVAGYFSIIATAYELWNSFNAEEKNRYCYPFFLFLIFSTPFCKDSLIKPLGKLAMNTDQQLNILKNQTEMDLYRSEIIPEVTSSSTVNRDREESVEQFLKSIFTIIKLYFLYFYSIHFILLAFSYRDSLLINPLNLKREALFGRLHTEFLRVGYVISKTMCRSLFASLVINYLKKNPNFHGSTYPYIKMKNLVNAFRNA